MLIYLVLQYRICILMQYIILLILHMPSQNKKYLLTGLAFEGCQDSMTTQLLFSDRLLRVRINHSTLELSSRQFLLKKEIDLVI